jgi:hypothetical protein
VKTKRKEELPKMNTEKKYRRSALVKVCYFLAALMAVYTCYQIGYTVYTINQYYAQYSMHATPMEYVTYLTQNGLQPLVNTVIFFMLAAILDAVRKNNPANYLSDEDIADAKMEKRADKDAKQFEKKEAAAEKAGRKPASKEEPVVADFTADTKEEPKKPAARKNSGRKPAAKKTDGEGKSASAKSGTAKKSSGRKPSAKKSAPKKTEEPKAKAEAKEEPKTEPAVEFSAETRDE